MEYDLEDIPLFGEWKISRLTDRPGQTEIVVDSSSREIDILGNISKDVEDVLLEIVSGTYSRFSFGRCSSSSNRPKVTFLITSLKGPKYWSNSCNIDSVLAILAYSTGISWRGLMMLSELKEPSSRKKDILKELHLPKGTCSVTRNILGDLPFSKLKKGGVWKMRRTGEIYDLITDIFPQLKIATVKRSHTTFRSLLALEDFIDGSIKIEDLKNQPHLVFENNLLYEHTDSLEPEEEKPEKINHLSLTLFNSYELCGIVFHEGVSPVSGPLEDIHSRHSLGHHYYSMLKLPDEKWYYYNDLEGGNFIQEDLESLSSRNGDVGVLYFYQRYRPLEKEKIVVRTPVKMDVSLDFTNEVAEYSNLASTIEFIGEGTPEGFIRVTFDDSDNRVEFERMLRS